MIYKYLLNLHGTTQLELPRDSQILSVQNQCGTLAMWVKLSYLSNEMMTRKFYTALTGENVDVIPRKNFLGTVQFDGGKFVVHVFEVLP